MCFCTIVEGAIRPSWSGSTISSLGCLEYCGSCATASTADASMAAIQQGALTVPLPSTIISACSSVWIIMDSRATYPPSTWRQTLSKKTPHQRTFSRPWHAHENTVNSRLVNGPFLLNGSLTGSKTPPLISWYRKRKNHYRPFQHQPWTPCFHDEEHFVSTELIHTVHFRSQWLTKMSAPS